MAVVSSWHSDRVAHGRTAAAPLLNDHVGNVYLGGGGGIWGWGMWEGGQCPSAFVKVLGRISNSK